ncbi:MAG: tRNA uridine-5-carboxymethylaminomethyl(34) synthesis GTPase MnmE, partial [Verrucomicrobiota bacterium]
VVLIDTAGLRQAADHLEAVGIQRTERQVETADLLLEVADASVPRPRAIALPATAATHMLLLNKSDLGEHASWHRVAALRLSCADATGFAELSLAIRDALHFSATEWGDHAIAINTRHQACLQTARRALLAALALLENPSTDPELAAIDLRDALDALGEISGRLDTEDLLGEIFSRFCIGK